MHIARVAAYTHKKKKGERGEVVHFATSLVFCDVGSPTLEYGLRILALLHRFSR